MSCQSELGLQLADEPLLVHAESILKQVVEGSWGANLDIATVVSNQSLFQQTACSFKIVGV